MSFTDIISSSVITDADASSYDSDKMASQFTETFGFPRKGKWGSMNYILSVPSGNYEDIELNSAGVPVYAGAQSSPYGGAVFLVEVLPSGEMSVVEDISYAGVMAEPTVADILFDYDLLDSDNEYYVESYEKKYGATPDDDARYSAAEDVDDSIDAPAPYSAGVTMMSDIGSHVPGQFPAKRRRRTCDE
jgi:hypothetical protein